MLVGYSCTLPAQELCAFNKVDAGRVGDSVQVYLYLNPDSLLQPRNSVTSFIPRIVADNDSVELPAIHVLGRNAYYRYIRHDNMGIIADADVVIWSKRRYRPTHYVKAVPCAPWMEDARLRIVAVTTEDCKTVDEHIVIERALARDFLVEVGPRVVERDSSITRNMSIVFPLSRTELVPDMANNRRELNKIRNSISEVRSNKSNVLKHMTIRGAASPEGKFTNNFRLAKERTEVLADYVSTSFNVPRSKITTEAIPEDWEGLVRFIRQTDTQNLPHRKEILEIAESRGMPYDEREQRIRTTYPREFRFIRDNYLPLLRHSDYCIDFIYHVVEKINGRTDTLQRVPRFSGSYSELLQPYRPYQALFAVKTNMLADAILAPNIEIELPLGRRNRWSLMAEYWTPWYVWRHNSRAYELQVWGLEARKWLGKCREHKAELTGTFLGCYAAYGRYDFEWNSVGDQGDFGSAGISFGHSWAINRHFNLEASVSAGVVIGERRHYNGEFNDSHLIWKYNKTLFYAGPTKAKISLVWIIGKKTKEGRR